MKTSFALMPTAILQSQGYVKLEWALLNEHDYVFISIITASGSAP
jgi:hypothetical protein